VNTKAALMVAGATCSKKSRATHAANIQNGNRFHHASMVAMDVNCALITDMNMN
jgi:hypothetical protein